MALVFVFCVEEELKGWIADFCNNKDLGVLCLGRSGKWELVSTDALVLSDAGYQFFLCPNRVPVPTGLSMNDVRPRDWGWITVRPGGLRKVEGKSVLLSSEIHGEKSDLETADPERLVQWLKNRIKQDARRGVRGRNLFTGGESTYENIWYTQQAKELFEAGTIWKQFPNDNSNFEPLNST